MQNKRKNNQLMSSRSVGMRDINALLHYAPISRIKTLRDDEGRRAFTLIELLVVVLIIGILAAVAVPQYQKAVIKSRMAEAQSMLTTLMKAQETYFLANDTYTDNLSALDVEIPSTQIATQWCQGSSAQPNTYMYSCNVPGGCAANASNPSMPLLQWSFINGHTGENAYKYIGAHQCSSMGKNSMAESICAAMSTELLSNKYYKIN